MANLKIFRETALPGVLEAYALYLIAPASDATLLEIVAVAADGTTARHVINKSDIQGMIDASMAAAGANNLIIVADITARDALAPETNIQVYVQDATGDATVASGGATYLYNLSATTWIKVSEAESLDVVLAWANLQDKPSSSVTDIDDAVTKRHSHANKTELDNIGENGAGELTYKGTQVKTEYASTAW
jgi:hypothetical protein